MPFYIKVGYDWYPIYSVEEIKEFYILEGKSKEEATELAKAFYDSQKSMIADERYRWRKAWKIYKQAPEPKEVRDDQES